MSKKTGLAACLLLAMGALPPQADAALYDRGHGLIYDSVLNITWLQDASYAQTSGFSSAASFTWSGAEAWVNQLDYLGITGWRLPTLTPVGGGTTFNTSTPSFDGSTDYAYNISAPGGASAGFTGNELAYMYFNNLHDLAQVKPDGTPQAGAGLVNVSFVDAATGKMDSFKNLSVAEGFWTDFSGTPVYAFLFLMATHPGFNDVANVSELEGAWAVHDGDVAALLAPSPPPSLLNAADAALGQLYGSSASAATTFAALAGPLPDPPASEPTMRLLSVITLLGLFWVARSRKPKSPVPFRRS